MEFEKITTFAIEVALKAGEILKNGYGTLFKISSKEGKHNLVTEYDLLSEKTIIQMILENYPDHHILSEESGITGKKHPYQWIVDPLDGTVNFAHNIPMFAVSIGVQKENTMIAGVVYNPIVDELFVAEKGKGAYLNNVKLKVSSTKDLDDAFVATGFPYNIKDDPDKCIERFAGILHLGIPIRRIGAAAIDLCYVAAGRFDGFWEVGLKPWDHAAGNLMIREAGGKVSTWDLEEFTVESNKPIMASNTIIHNQIHKALHCQN